MGRKVVILLLNSAAQMATTRRKESEAPTFHTIIPSIPAIELIRIPSANCLLSLLA
jgi:hypothetical protein